MRFSCREAETYCQRYADLTCHEVSLSEGKSYCMRTVEVQAYDDVFPVNLIFLFCLGKRSK